MTKNQANWYNMFNRSNAHYISDVYKSYSYKKELAFNTCKQRWNEDIDKFDWNNVSDMRIISHNCDFFTVAWQVTIDDKQYLRVITPSNRYFFETGIFV